MKHRTLKHQASEFVSRGRQPGPADGKNPEPEKTCVRCPRAFLLAASFVLVTVVLIALFFADIYVLNNHAILLTQIHTSSHLQLTALDTIRSTEGHVYQLTLVGIKYHTVS